MVAICAAVVLIVMTVSGSFMLLYVRNTEIDNARNELSDRARFINSQIVQNVPPGQWIDEFEDLNRMPAGVNDIQAVVLSATGWPIAPEELRPLRFTDQAVIAAMAGEPGFTIGTRGLDLNGIEQEWIAFTMPVERDGISYIIYTRMSARPMNDHLSNLTQTIMLMVLMALVITVVLWYIFASTLSGPIVGLTRHAKEMAQGHLDKEMVVHGRDEIGQLTESFNHMAKELNVMVSSLALEKNKHETVLHNMTDGVLAYDANGTITHANSAASILLQTEDSIMNLEAFNLREMLEMLGFKLDPESSGWKVLTEGEMEETEEGEIRMVFESIIPISDRYIAASYSPYTNHQGEADGFIIVLQDITKHTRLDNMRREFVANVSHELRTPLSSICSYSETLISGALDDRETAESFLRVIDAEAKRMSVLVTDLLELSRLDNNPMDMEVDMEFVDLVGLTKMAVKQTEVAAREKDQKIVFDGPSDPYFIEAAPSRLNQVLVNILSNSIKYSPPNTNIEVNMEETDSNYRVMIQDYGMGMSKEDLPRIFERFYRVDKARSRAMGGTGLGLAIAKEIVEAHGGKITATSEPGKGTLMVLSFIKSEE